MTALRAVWLLLTARADLARAVPPILRTQQRIERCLQRGRYGGLRGPVCVWYLDDEAGETEILYSPAETPEAVIFELDHMAHGFASTRPIAWHTRAAACLLLGPFERDDTGEYWSRLNNL